MPKLSERSIAGTPQSVILYGAPKSGKTKLAGTLAKHFDLLWIDLENGHSTLFQHPMEWQERIELIQVHDVKTDPQAINTTMKLLTGAAYKVCDDHGRIGCPKCITKPVGKGCSSYELNKLDPLTTIVVFDSLTQLTSSAEALSTKGLDSTKGQFAEFKHHRLQGTLLEKCLDLIQNARFNIVVIAHEAGIEQVDKSEKIMPAGGTKNFARNVSKYFGHIIHLSVKNKKHIGMSGSTDHNQVLTGSRTNFEIDLDDEDSLSNLFKGIKSKPKPSPARR